MRAHCELDSTSAKLLRSAVDRFGLSARAYHRVLRVARTIADLANSESIDLSHLAEAIQYQPRDPYRGGSVADASTQPLSELFDSGPDGS